MSFCKNLRIKHAIKNKVVILLACLALVVTVNAQAEKASLTGNIINLPVVIVGDYFFSVKLEIVPESFPLETVLIEAEQLFSVSTLGASIFNNNTLTVSDLELGGVSYWIDFEFVVDVGFVLWSYGINDVGLSTNDLGLSFQPEWERMFGEASDISISDYGDFWAIGTDFREGGYGIYYWTGQTWNRVDGGAVRVEVDPYGNPWVINDIDEIYRLVDGLWQRLPGNAIDIGIGANGAVWIVSDGGVYNWNGTGWDKYQGSGVRVDVDPTGKPWVVSYNDEIYQFSDGGWIRMPGEARDIGIGGDGSVWVIGTRRDEGGHGIYRWTGDTWNRVEGSGRQITVDYYGQPWVSSSSGDIYRAW